MTNKQKNRSFSIALVTSIILATLPYPSGAVYSQSAAESYLISSTSNDWSVMALASIGKHTNLNLGFLNQSPGSNPIDYARRILAKKAVGTSTTAEVSSLVSAFNGTEIVTSGNLDLLNDDIFGLLALSAVGGYPNERSTLRAFIKANQNSDGGFSHYKSPSSSNSDITAMAVMALIADGESSGSESVTRAVGFLATAKTATGYSHFPGGSADPYSTSWVLSALSAASQTRPQSAIRYLENLQDPNGSFSGNSVLTAYAFLALNGTSYPVRQLSGPAPQTPGDPVFRASIIGPNGQIFSGNLQFQSFTAAGQNFSSPHAIGIVVKASETNSSSFDIRSTPFGMYVYSIDGFGPSGDRGWLYAVNGTKPSVSAANFPISDGDHVIWFYGGPNDPIPGSVNTTPSNSTSAAVDLDVNIINQSNDNSGNNATVPTVSVTADKTNINLGETVTLIWNSQNASVLVSSSPSSWAGSALLGRLSVQPSQTTTYLISVQGPGGTAQSSVTVQVNSAPAIVFGVDVTSIDFGNLVPGGQSNTKLVRMSNQANQSIDVTTTLENSDSVYTSGLTIENQPWNLFRQTIGPRSNTQVSLKLSVPQGYSGVGSKRARLIFWATPK